MALPVALTASGTVCQWQAQAPTGSGNFKLNFKFRLNFKFFLLFKLYGCQCTWQHHWHCSVQEGEEGST